MLVLSFPISFILSYILRMNTSSVISSSSLFLFRNLLCIVFSIQFIYIFISKEFIIFVRKYISLCVRIHYYLCDRKKKEVKYSRLKIIENHHLSHFHCMLCHLTLSFWSGWSWCQRFWILVMRHHLLFSSS